MHGSSIPIVSCIVQPFRQLKSLFHKTQSKKEESRNEEKLGNGSDSRNSSLENETPLTAKCDDLKSSTIETTQSIRPNTSDATVAAHEDSISPAPVPRPELLHPNRSQGSSSDDSQSQRSRADTTGSSPEPESSLKNLLYDARIECQIEHCFIVPRCTQDRLITVSSVASDIRSWDPCLSEEEVMKLSQEICESAKRLYAVLVCVKKGGDIQKLLDEGIRDEDLPLIRQQHSSVKFDLRLADGGRVQTVDRWEEKVREKFDRAQWWMTAPVFDLRGDYDLPHKTVLPFIPFEGDEVLKSGEGGYSRVYPVRIHPSHHEFWPTSGSLEKEPLIALKQLKSSDETDFKKEQAILTALGPKEHPHLIKLLASFKHDDKYHFMFPWADGNLRKYWQMRPTPDFDRETLMWSLSQMKGIASGISLIHNFSVTIPLGVPGSKNIRIVGNATMQVKRGEEMYGRHGDIKPENILWFSNGPEPHQDMGILQLADFGLGRFHGRDSRSKINPETVVGTDTYEPPECKLHKPVSRAYDIWSLGCVYLEFATWLLNGAGDTRWFSEFRGRTASSAEVNDDHFYTLTNHGTKAIIKEPVVEWVEQLHSHAKCSEFIHQLLDFTMKELLVVDPKQRCKAARLVQFFRDCSKSAEENKDFLIKGVPRPRKITSPSQRQRSLPLNSRYQDRILEHFTSARGRLAFILPPEEAAKDLVLKKLGAPSCTWPQVRPVSGPE